MNMGRRRKTHRHLPERVYIHHGSYRYHPKSGKKITLARIDDYSGMLRALAAVMQDRPPLTTLATVMDRYELQILPKKAASTQKEQARMLANLCRSFGAMNPGDLRQPHAAQYRDKRGQKAPTTANRELELLSHVCTMAVEWGAMELNPLTGLRKNSRPPRERCPSDADYLHVYGLAAPMVQCVMDLALLTGLRRKDLFRLHRSGMSDDGLALMPSKTKHTSRVNLLFEWTPALRSVVKRALSLSPQLRPWIVCNRKGQQYTKNGFDSVWNRLMAKATAGEDAIERFQFLDLRRKSASDEVDELVAQQRLGHASVEITNRVYRVKPKKVRPLR